jgi:hypothetical protein
MIYIFVKNRYFILQAYITTLYLLNVYKIQCEVLFSLEDADIKRDTIIPFGIDESKECYMVGIKNTLVMNPKIYDLLDNKATCFVFAEVNKVPAVNTFIHNSSNNLHSFVNKYSDMSLFITKPKLSLDSLNIRILDGTTLLNEYSTGQLDINNIVVQPYLDNHKLYNLNAVCKAGVIVDFFILTQDNNFKLDNMFGKNIINYKRHIVLKNNPNYSRILNSSKNLIAASIYNGLIDIDFLCNDHESLFLEINPRVSGQINTIYDSKLIYLEKLILNYIILFESKKNKLKLKNQMNQTKFKYIGNGINMRYPITYGIISLILLIIAGVICYKLKR